MTTHRHKDSKGLWTTSVTDVDVSDLDAKVDHLTTLTTNLSYAVAALNERMTASGVPPTPGVPSQPEEPLPNDVVIDGSRLQATLSNNQLDRIWLSPGTYTLPQIKLPNRTRPVDVRPVTPGSVIFRQGTPNEGAFQAGYNSVAANVSISGLILDGYVIGSTGLVWCGNAHDLAFNDFTIRNCRAASGTPSDNAWGLYLSYDAGIGASRITADRWTMQGSSRSLSGLQLQYGQLHTDIRARGWNVRSLAFALYAKANAIGFDVSDWVIDDSGIRTSSVYFGDWSAAEPLKGSYARMSLSNSLPILDQASGMVAL